MPKTLLVLCTCPDRDVALELSGPLIEQGLAACVNILAGVTSVYRWEGRVAQEAECLLLIKTTEARYPALEQALRTRHPYELPEIIAVPIEQGLAEYLQWVDRCTKTSR